MPQKSLCQHFYSDAQHFILGTLKPAIFLYCYSVQKNTCQKFQFLNKKNYFSFQYFTEILVPRMKHKHSNSMHTANVLTEQSSGHATFLSVQCARRGSRRTVQFLVPTYYLGTYLMSPVRAWISARRLSASLWISLFSLFKCRQKSTAGTERDAIVPH